MSLVSTLDPSTNIVVLQRQSAMNFPSSIEVREFVLCFLVILPLHWVQKGNIAVLQTSLPSILRGHDQPLLVHALMKHGFEVIPLCMSYGNKNNKLSYTKIHYKSSCRVKANSSCEKTHNCLQEQECWYNSYFLSSNTIILPAGWQVQRSIFTMSLWIHFPFLLYFFSHKYSTTLLWSHCSTSLLILQIKNIQK